MQPASDSIGWFWSAIDDVLASIKLPFFCFRRFFRRRRRDDFFFFGGGGGKEKCFLLLFLFRSIIIWMLNCMELFKFLQMIYVGRLLWIPWSCCRSRPSSLRILPRIQDACGRGQGKDSPNGERCSPKQRVALWKMPQSNTQKIHSSGIGWISRSWLLWFYPRFYRGFSEGLCAEFFGLALRISGRFLTDSCESGTVILPFLFGDPLILSSRSNFDEWWFVCMCVCVCVIFREFYLLRHQTYLSCHHLTCCLDFIIYHLSFPVE